MMTKATAVMGPNELIKKLIAESPAEGGSVFLDDFCNQLPDVPRAICVNALKTNRDVVFIVGRKGHMSRAIYGPMKDDYKQAPSFKSPMASGPIRLHIPRRRAVQTDQPVVAEETELNASEFRLRVVVQGQEVFLPIEELELVPAKMAA